MDITIEDKSVTELKALAYDMLASRQQAEMNLAAINKEIIKREQDGGTDSKPGLDADSTGG